jgi:hypothetical protein
MPTALFHPLIRGYKPQQWPKQNDKQERNKEPKEFRFSPPFWQQVPKKQGESEKKAQESISSRRRIGRRIGSVVGKEGPHHVFLE